MSTQKMKTKAVGAMVLTFLLSLGSYSTADAQGVLDRLEKKVENKVEKRVERKVDRSIDKGLDKAEDKVDGNKSSKKNNKTADNKNSGSNDKTNGNANTGNTQTGNTQPAVVVTNNGSKPKPVNMLTVNSNVAKASSMDAEWVNSEANNYSMMANMGTPGPSTNTGTSSTNKSVTNNSGTGNNSGAATDGGNANATTNNTNATTNNATTNNSVGSASSPEDKEGQGANTKPNTNAGTNSNAGNNANTNTNTGNNGTRLNVNANTNWEKYDFTPGELAIFADNEAKAQDGEFPNDFRLLKGSAEYSDMGNEKAISFLGIPTEIAPKMKTEAFLPQVFTVEFDAYFHNIENESYILRFKGMQDIEARLNSVAMGDFNGYTTDNLQQAAWRHIAVVFNPQGMKMYVDQFRVVNIPKVDVKPSSFTIYANNDGAKTGNRAMIRNFRLYDASVVPVDRFKADGKLVTHGITFSSGSADLNPESAGTLNLVAEMLSEDPDLKMSIEVHSEKTAASSSDLQILTDKRAAAIKSALVARGVDGTRLTAKGMGDFKPIDSNDSASGRQNNRRVEFVKM